MIMKNNFLLIFIIISSLFLFISCGDDSGSGDDDDDDNDDTPPEIPTEGLIHCYLFEGNAQDTGSDPKHGTVDGAVLCTGHNGEQNSAYSFDGSSSIDLDFYSLPDDCTISLWMKTSETDGTFAKWFETAPMSPSMSFSIYNGKIAYRYYNGGATFGVNGTSDRNDNTWVHVVFTKDSSDTFTIIVNGTPEASGDPGISTTSDSLKFGQGLTGEIDNIYIYNRILTGEEIGELYFNG
jgi:hypothetical protein